MMHLLNKSKIVLIILFFFFLISGCYTRVKETTDTTTKVLPNGKRLTVYTTHKESSEVGVLTNNKYMVTFSFRYEVLIKPDRIHWNGQGGEPKNILFCNDKTYIRKLKRKIIDSKYYIDEYFQSHVDERYFFKLLGEEYWLDIDAEEYNGQKMSCEEYPIPNDNKLSLPSIAVDKIDIDNIKTIRADKLKFKKKLI